MHSVTFLQDLAVVMIVAGMVTVLFHRLKQPVVLGYILAGVIVGPHTLPFPLIHEEETIRTLAELGVVFLMFSVGMEFSLRKLKGVGIAALVAALLEIPLMVFLGYEIGRLFGWSVMDSMFLGAMVSISSTTIIVKTLAEMGKTKEKFSELIFGILIFEDILAIVMIVLLSGIAMSSTFRASEVLVTLGKLGIFLAVALVLGLLAVPRLLGFVAKFKSDEMLLVTALGLCFGVSLLAVKLGYSVALGAFIIGAVVAEARELGRIETLTEPIRDMFCAVFFVAIGMLIQPKMLLEHAGPIAVLALAVILGKVLACAFGSFVAGNDTRSALRVGMGLAQIGEFSFIIAALGMTLKVTSDFLYPIAVAVSAITTLVSPYLIRSADGLLAWFDRVAPTSVINYLELYTRWMGQHGEGRKSDRAARLIRKWLWQVGLHQALTAAVFIGAAFVAERAAGWFPQAPLSADGWKAVLWLVAVVVTLPLFIATFGKFQALGWLIADLSVSEALAGERAKVIRSLVAQAIPLTGVVGLSLLALLLSSALLPPLNVLLVLLFVAGLIVWLFGRTLKRVYSQAQFALEATFNQPPPERHAAAPEPLTRLLQEAELATVVVTRNSLAAGKLIRELQLRTQTGASIVGIERQTARLINPSPDEELQPGDQVLLLGNHPQLDAARKIFSATASAAP